VKNNLQLISSMLNLQASRVDDSRIAELFAESRNRVRSMALVHENLYRAGDFAQIAMDEHIKTLCRHLFRAYGPATRDIRMVIDVEDIHLDLDRAVSAGLIVNELVSNAFKHAFPEGRVGTVRVELKRKGRRGCALAVMDDGVGLPMDIESQPSVSLGLQLVQDLTDQLRGEIVIDRAGRTSFTLLFDLEGRRDSMH
jgi:two-component sensor histidine kinase